MRSTCLLIVMVVLGLFGIQSSVVQAQQPVIHAVLFFSPSCGHCHYVINEVVPPLQEEYGTQLQMLYIDVSQPAGSELYFAMCDTLEVPDDVCGYVPVLVVGTTVLSGSRDIPEQLPTLVQGGIAAGGIDLPPIPGLKESYEAMMASQQTGESQEDASASAPISTTYREMTWRDRLKQAQLGNSFALGVLGILIVGLGVQLRYGARLFGAREMRHWEMSHLERLLVVGLALITTIIAGTLALESSTVSLPAVLAAGVTCGLVAIVWAIWRSLHHSEQSVTYHIPGWVLPAVACLGLVVAGYLAYVEVGENEAVCGAVGDCQTVQQSEYAKLFGLIPIGVFGIFGYVLILVVWGVRRYASGWIADGADAALLGMGLFGVLFSLYLTFLEPFVIGATCAWCLTSAMMMILILCLHAPAGWPAVDGLANRLALRLHRPPSSTWDNEPVQE